MLCSSFRIFAVVEVMHKMTLTNQIIFLSVLQLDVTEIASCLPAKLGITLKKEQLDAMHGELYKHLLAMYS